MITLKTLRSEAEKQVGAVAERLTKRSTALGAEAGKLAGDPTPAYAVVGLTDAVIERARTATEKFGKVRTLTPQLVAEQLTKAGTEVTERVTKTAAGLTDQVTKATADLGKTVEEAPTVVVSGVLTRLGKVQGEYTELAKRGEGLVARVRRQKATQELAAQVEQVVKQGRQLLGTARTGAKQTESAAKATVTSGRRQVAATIAPETTPAKAEPAAKPAAKKSTAKSTTAKTTTTAKPAVRKSTAKSTAAKTGTAKTSTAKTSTPKAAPAKSAPAKKSTAKPATRKATAPATATQAAAKRTVTTAAKRAEETAGAAKSTTDAMAKVAEKVAEAATDAAAKTGTSTTAKADSAKSDS
jgi:hypothetical protein